MAAIVAGAAVEVVVDWGFGDCVGETFLYECLHKIAKRGCLRNFFWQAVPKQPKILKPGALLTPKIKTQRLLATGTRRFSRG